MSNELNELLQEIREAFDSGTLISLVLSNPVSPQSKRARKQSVRPVIIRGQQLFQWELQFEKQQSHLNLSAVNSFIRFEAQFGPHYRDVHLFTSAQDVVAKATPQGFRLRRLAASRALPIAGQEHNRKKEYLIPEGVPCPFLIELDVMTPAGQVKQPRQKKFRQINRYLEIVNDIYDQLPATGVLRVVDFGCGLSYLTFALHHLLTVIRRREVHFLGIDQNAHVISRCREIAEKLNLNGLEFTSAAIENHAPTSGLDLAVSLHACDTATDSALAFAVRTGAQVILAAPCCQHEVAKSIQSPELNEILRHGILKERLAAMATDSLRATALEAVGYRTQIIEFIELEHTPKNVLLRAVRRQGDERNSAEREQSRLRFSDLKSKLGLNILATDMILQAGDQTSRDST